MSRDFLNVLIVVSIIKALFTIFMAAVMLVAIYAWDPEGIRALIS